MPLERPPHQALQHSEFHSMNASANDVAVHCRIQPYNIETALPELLAPNSRYFRARCLASMGGSADAIAM